VTVSNTGARDAGILGQNLQSRRYFTHLGIGVELGGRGREQPARHDRSSSGFFGHMGSFHIP
jgi:hypothetical protein